MRVAGPTSVAMCGTLAFVLLSIGVPPAAYGEQTARATEPASATCDRGAFRVVVDVGHTADIPGAISARGVPEYEFNHRLATLIAQRLTESGFAQTVLLVTMDPPTRGLFQRVRHANHLPAHLFLSIHHDSVPTSLLEKWDHNGVERRFSDRFKGHSLFISHGNPERRASLLFATLLGRELKARGLRYTPHYTEPIMGGRRRELLDAETGVYRYDQLVVLRDSRMPAVLLEAGSIINRDEELLMATSERQALIAAAVLDAVEIFCARKGR
jgi:N-acetylmuramoyl-L-alanine amidase